MKSLRHALLMLLALVGSGCAAHDPSPVRTSNIKHIPVAVVVDDNLRSRQVVAKRDCTGRQSACASTYLVDAGELLIAVLKDRLGTTFDTVREIRDVSEAEAREVVVLPTLLSVDSACPGEDFCRTIETRVNLQLRIESPDGTLIASSSHERFSSDTPGKGVSPMDFVELGVLLADLPLFPVGDLVGKSVHEMTFIQRRFSVAIAEAMVSTVDGILGPMLWKEDTRSALNWFHEHGRVRPTVADVIEKVVGQVFPDSVPGTVVAVLPMTSDPGGSFAPNQASDLLRSTLTENVQAIVVDHGLQERVLSELRLDIDQMVASGSCRKFAMLSSADVIIAFRLKADEGGDRFIEARMLDPEDCSTSREIRESLDGR